MSQKSHGPVNMENGQNRFDMNSSVANLYSFIIDSITILLSNIRNRIIYRYI